MLAEANGSNGNRNRSDSLEVLAGTHQYGIKANWKLLVENSIDGYHLGPTHATYFQFLKEQKRRSVAKHRHRCGCSGTGTQ